MKLDELFEDIAQQGVASKESKYFNIVQQFLSDVPKVTNSVRKTIEQGEVQFGERETSKWNQYFTTLRSIYDPVKKLFLKLQQEPNKKLAQDLNKHIVRLIQHIEQIGHSLPQDVVHSNTFKSVYHRVLKDIETLQSQTMFGSWMMDTGDAEDNNMRKATSSALDHNSQMADISRNAR